MSGIHERMGEAAIEPVEHVEARDQAARESMPAWTKKETRAEVRAAINDAFDRALGEGRH